jgi:transcription regulator, CRP family
MDSMYEILMGLPLFKGVSRQRISEIVGMAKLHFMKYLAGETVISVGSPCTHITFIISGSVRVSIKNPDGRFCVSQTLKAPDIISPEYLFGRATTYPCTAVAEAPTGILQISKTDYLKILDTDRVFLFNFLNILSRSAQKSVDGVLALTNGSLRERIAFWIICLTQPGGTDVKLTCRQRDLYSLFGVPRSSLIATLDAMKAEGLITYAPGEISVVSRPALLATLVTNAE